MYFTEKANAEHADKISDQPLTGISLPVLLTFQRQNGDFYEE